MHERAPWPRWGYQWWHPVVPQPTTTSNPEWRCWYRQWLWGMLMKSEQWADILIVGTHVLGNWMEGSGNGLDSERRHDFGWMDGWMDGLISCFIFFPFSLYPLCNVWMMTVFSCAFDIINLQFTAVTWTYLSLWVYCNLSRVLLNHVIRKIKEATVCSMGGLHIHPERRN